jgi:putative restriction endonuclease
MDSKVPVGFMWQISPKPNSIYRIYGLASVVAWEKGYFVLEGFTPGGTSHEPHRRATHAAQIQSLNSSYEPSLPPWAYPHSQSDQDEVLRRSLQWSVTRQGQPEFRSALLLAYDGKCAITSCDVEEGLEAAHIQPYSGPMSNSLENGLLLRADIHTLFDRGLIGINPSNLKVILADELEGSQYEEFRNTYVRLPVSFGDRPGTVNLQSHISRFDLV